MYREGQNHTKGVGFGGPRAATLTAIELPAEGGAVNNDKPTRITTCTVDRPLVAPPSSSPSSSSSSSSGAKKAPSPFGHRLFGAKTPSFSSSSTASLPSLGPMKRGRSQER
eukprot:PhM_4_TR16086/c0_g1_i2/m.38374